MDQIEKMVKFLLQKLPEVKGIYLYGSRARGLERIGSDYDVAVLNAFPRQLTSEEEFDWANELAASIGEEVDLVDLRAIPLDLRFEVVARGKRIYCADQHFCDDYESTGGK